ncbi:unnamed protein product [Closterium sp. Yama58-4]|nr:unnamed protein product [Closterium sp. Yama58-4]
MRMLHTHPTGKQGREHTVDWYPWGEEAFTKAREEGKLIFLSVGYSTCHWCHVMEVESFERADVADVMNEGFVNIKVDREERPDVDKVYMTYVQATQGGGGWPMSVFLTPSLHPVFGGTYFPPDDKYGRIGFKSLLGRVRSVWEQRRSEVQSGAEDAMSQLQEAMQGGGGAVGVAGKGKGKAEQQQEGKQQEQQEEERVWKLAEKAVQLCSEQLASRYDEDLGGSTFVPSTMGPGALQMVEHTLQCWVRWWSIRWSAWGEGGCMHDHVGGGFLRYSVDEYWHVPHFEKMLYDQGQLANAYLDAFLVTGRTDFARMGRDILDYVRRDMTHGEGGIYSAEDADSLAAVGDERKKEGAFYVWSEKEHQGWMDMTHGEGGIYGAEDADSLAAVGDERKKEGAFYIASILGPSTPRCRLFTALYTVRKDGNCDLSPRSNPRNLFSISPFLSFTPSMQIASILGPSTLRCRLFTALYTVRQDDNCDLSPISPLPPSTLSLQIASLLGASTPRCRLFTTLYTVRKDGNCDLSPRSNPRNEFAGLNCLIQRCSVSDAAKQAGVAEEEAEKVRAWLVLVLNGSTLSPRSDPHNEFAGLNCLIQRCSLAEAAEKVGAGVVGEMVGAGESGNRRPRPHLDDKVIVAWNGLMISAFARASRILQSEPATSTHYFPDDGSPPSVYLACAERATSFVRSKLYDRESKRLRRSFRESASEVGGFADDYAFLVASLLDLFEASGDADWLAWAMELQETQDRLFWDEQQGAYFNTAEGDPSLLLRMKEDYDGAEPAASFSSYSSSPAHSSLHQDRLFWDELQGAYFNTAEGDPSLLLRMKEDYDGAEPAASSAAAASLARLGAMIGGERGVEYRRKAARCVRQVIIAGPRGAPETEALLNAVFSVFQPNCTIIPIDFANQSDAAFWQQHNPRALAMAAKGMSDRSAAAATSAAVPAGALSGATSAAYVCQNMTCLAPVSETEKLVSLLKGGAAGGSTSVSSFTLPAGFGGRGAA